MKKLIILFVISSLITIYIYNKNYQKVLTVTSINSLSSEEDFNPYLSSIFSKSSINYDFNIDYTNNSIEIENIIGMINNDDKFKNIIHSSNVIIISLGNIDKLNEDINTITKELKELFKLVRKLNNQEIIYVSPYSFNNTVMIKEECNKNNILFINGRSFKNSPTLIAQILYKSIENAWNKEKY